MDSVSSIVHVGENQSKESRSHPSSGPHLHNEPFTHLEHSRGNQTTPTQSSDTLASDHHRRRTEWLGIERSQHHQSFIAGYERWIVPPKVARTTRSKAGYTSSRGPPCTRIDNVYSVGEPPRLSISQKISEKEERERVYHSLFLF